MSEFSSDNQPETRGAGGQKRHKVVRDALMLALEREVKIAGKPTRRITQIAEAICRKAAEGDVTAAKEIFDRVDGKADANLTLNASDAFIEALKRINALRQLAGELGEVGEQPDHVRH